MAEYCYTNHPYKVKPSGKAQSFLVHRKVWEENFGEIPEGMVIHHKNGNKKDNRINNLKIVTRSEHRLIHLQKKLSCEEDNSL